MILGFKEKFPWEDPTYFREKILAGVGYMQSPESAEKILSEYPRHVIHPLSIYTPKIHTIRAGNRWRAGMSIQMAYGVRTKNYQQFNKGIPELEVCTGVQKIDIDVTFASISRAIKQPKEPQVMRVFIYRGGRKELFAVFPIAANVTVATYFMDNAKLLAVNDGFENIYSFTRWFYSKAFIRFSGQIIHWTDFRY